jgi:hydroxyisourate hydrolase
MTTGRTASVSTHVLDTSAGRPAAGVAVTLATRTGHAGWAPLGTSRTDADGRCTDLPALPAGITHARLGFDTGTYLTGPTAAARGQIQPAGARQQPPGAPDGDAFFPEVTVVFAVAPGEHHHVPLLLSPYGYSVYRGS